MVAKYQYVGCDPEFLGSQDVGQYCPLLLQTLWLHFNCSIKYIFHVSLLNYLLTFNLKSSHFYTRLYVCLKSWNFER